MIDCSRCTEHLSEHGSCYYDGEPENCPREKAEKEKKVKER